MQDCRGCVSVQGLVVLAVGVRTGTRSAWLALPCCSRSPSVQQRALLRHALWDGDQILQWPRSALPHEEGAALALEDCAGKEGLRRVPTRVLRFFVQQRKEVLPSELAVVAPSSFSGVQLGSLCPTKPASRFHPVRDHWILVSGAGYQGQTQSGVPGWGLHEGKGPDTSVADA